MGIKERRSAEKEALKKSILETAQILFREEGSWQGVTMRNIAAAIQYSLPTIYEHFENKDAILKALQGKGFVILCDMLTERLHDTSLDPAGALLKIAQVHWDFAWEYPDLYRIMLNEKISREDHLQAIMFIRTTMQKALQDLSSCKISDAQLYDDKIGSMRGIMHGFTMLALVGSMEKERAFMLMMRTLHNAMEVV